MTVLRRADDRRGPAGAAHPLDLRALAAGDACLPRPGVAIAEAGRLVRARAQDALSFRRAGRNDRASPQQAARSRLTNSSASPTLAPPCSNRPARAPRSNSSGTAGRDRRTGRPPRPASGRRPWARAAFARAGARTEPSRLFETGGLRWRFPRSTDPCEAVIVNTGGGVAAGDSYEIALDARRRRRGRSDHHGGGKDLPQRRPVRPHRDRADARARRAPRLAAAGDDPVRRRARLDRTLTIDMAADAEPARRRDAGVRPSRDGGDAHRGVASRFLAPHARRPAGFRRRDPARPCGRDASIARPAAQARARSRPPRRGARHRGAPARICGRRSKRAKPDVEAGASAFDGLIVCRLISASPSRLRVTAIAAIVALSGRQPPRLWR